MDSVRYHNKKVWTEFIPYRVFFLFQNLLWVTWSSWVCPCLLQGGGLDWMIFKGPFQLKLFYDCSALSFYIQM